VSSRLRYAVVTVPRVERLPASNRLVQIFAALSKSGNVVVPLAPHEQRLGKETSADATTSTRQLRPRRTPVRIRWVSVAPVTGKC